MWKINHSYTVDELGKFYCNEEYSKYCDKYCIRCWLTNNIKRTKEELVRREAKISRRKKRPSYEESEEGKELKNRIEWVEKSVNSQEKRLPEFTCLKIMT